MSIATSLPCMKLSSPSSNSSSTPSTSFKFSPIITIHNSKAEGPLRRPIAPPLREPSIPSLKPIPPSPPSTSPSTPKPVVSSGVSQLSSQGVTMEFQRKVAKELQDYFRQKKLEEANQGPFFGWIAKNEISNGRWAMFGFAVGMLTEYATGSDFVVQVKILLSNFGILDLD
ncbi:hypothetical protein GIB67_014545 [Kingdonia uniflora]|uniref:Uncharacterized protein n=1 Tax=Kingdonia uniflora TaxID=39325 RepID=A0A7J7LKC7_9MAGN|nr:hypothetical protein GIB67_014545 [Kingdonia uniflora]